MTQLISILLGVSLARYVAGWEHWIGLALLASSVAVLLYIWIS